MKKFIIPIILLSIITNVFAARPHPDVEMPDDREKAILLQLSDTYAAQESVNPDLHVAFTREEMQYFLDSYATLYNRSNPFDRAVHTGFLSNFSYLTNTMMIRFALDARNAPRDTHTQLVSPESYLAFYSTYLAEPFRIYQKFANTIFRHVFGVRYCDDDSAIRTYEFSDNGKRTIFFLKDTNGVIPVIHNPNFINVLFQISYGELYERALYMNADGDPITCACIVVEKNPDLFCVNYLHGSNSETPFKLEFEKLELGIYAAQEFAPNGIPVGRMIKNYFATVDEETTTLHVEVPETQEEYTFASLNLLKALVRERDELTTKKDGISKLVAISARRIETLPAGEDSSNLQSLKEKSEQDLAKVEHDLANIEEKTQAMEELTGQPLERTIIDIENKLLEDFKRSEQNRLAAEEAEYNSAAAIEARKAEKLRKKEAKKKGLNGKKSRKSRGSGSVKIDEDLSDTSPQQSDDQLREKFSHYAQTQNLKQRKFAELVQRLVRDAPAENLRGIKIRGSHITFHANEGEGVTYVTRHGGDDMLSAGRMNSILSGLLTMLYSPQQ